MKNKTILSMVWLFTAILLFGIGSSYAQPNAGPDRTICEDSLFMSGNIQPGATWALVSGSGVIVNPSNALTKVKGLNPGFNYFRWFTGVTADTVAIYFNKPTVSNAGMDQNICTMSANLSANSLGGGEVGSWYVIQGGATITFSNINQNTTTVNGLPRGTNRLKWSISKTFNNVTCSSFDLVDIVSNRVEAVVGQNISVYTNYANLYANQLKIGEQGYWSVVGGTATLAQPTLYNTMVTNLSIGQNIFKWSVTQNGCNAFNNMTVTFSQNVSAYAGQDLTICKNSFKLAGNDPQPALGTWTQIKGSGVIKSPNLPNSEVTNLSEGENIFVWQVNSSTLGGNGNSLISRDTVKILNNMVSIADAGTDKVVSVDSVFLSAITPISGQGQWSKEATNGSVFSSFVSNAVKVKNLSSGYNRYKWTITKGICVSTDEVIIAYNRPGGSNAGSDLIICQDQIALSADIPAAGVIGTWSKVGNSNALISNVNQYNTYVSGLVPGENKFVWSLSTGAKDTVNIFNHMPQPSFAGNDFISYEPIATLKGIKVGQNQGIGKWFVDAGSATLEFPDSAFTGVSNLSPGMNKFKYIITQGECKSVAHVVINFVPGGADAGPDQVICSNNTLLIALPPTVGTGVWTLVSGNASIQNPNSPKTNIVNIAPGKNVFRWTVSVAGKQNYDEVLVMNNSLPLDTIPKFYEVTDGMVTLQETRPFPTTAQRGWIADGGFATIASPLQFSTVAQNLRPGDNGFTFVVNNDGCKVFYKHVVINKQFKAFAGVDKNICESSTLLEGMLMPLPGVSGRWELISGSAVIVNPTLHNTAVQNLKPLEANTFRWTLTYNGITSTDNVIVTNNSPAPANAGVDQAVNTTYTNLNAVQVGLPTKGFWFKEGGEAFIVTPSANNSVVINLNPGQNTFVWVTYLNGCKNYDKVLITNNKFMANAGVDQVVCRPEATLLANKIVNASGKWSVVSGTGTLKDANAAGTYVTGLGLGLNIFRWTLTQGTESVSDDVVILNNAPQMPNAGLDTIITATANDSVRLRAIRPTVGAGKWLQIDVVFGDAKSDLSQVNSNLTSYKDWNVIKDPTMNLVDVIKLRPGANTFRWVVENKGCIAFDEVVIYNNKPGANAGPDVVVCQPFTKLSANNLIAGYTGSWGVVGGSATFVSANKSITDAKDLGMGVNTLRWTVTGGGQNYMDDVDIIVNAIKAKFEIRKSPSNPLEINFVNKSEGKFTICNWSFGDGTTSKDYATNHKYEKPGLYEVCLTVFNELSGCKDYICLKVDAGSMPCIAKFNYVVNQATKAVTITDQTMGGATKWYWTFGDGGFANIQNPPAKTYANHGAYDVCLKIATANCQSERCEKIVIQDPNCSLRALFAVVQDTNGVQLTDKSEGVASHRMWQFGDGTTSQEKDIFKEYAKDGIYMVTLAVKDTASKCYDMVSQRVQVGTISCKADFEANVDIANLTVNFKDISTGNINKYQWKFDDGTFASTGSPSHKFPRKGIFKVALAVTDGVCYDKIERVIQIDSVKCQADFHFFIDSLENKVVLKNKSIVSANAKYTWKFSDGGIVSNQTETSHKFLAAGYHKVTLTVQDGICIAKAEKEIVVGNLNIGFEPEFDFYLDPDKKEVKFADKSMGENLNYYWDFGNGESSLEQMPTYTYSNSKLYNVCLTVYGGNNLRKTKCKPIDIPKNGTVANCFAKFVVAVDSASKQLTLTNLSSTDANSFSWEFGDGSKTTDTITQNPTRTYAASGFYKVHLKIKTPTCIAHAYELINVAKGNQGLQCTFGADQQASTLKGKGYPVDMVGATFGTAAEFEWSFGDGTFNNTSLSPTHTYATTGTYNVCFSINDPATNQTATSCSQVVVTDVTGNTQTFNQSVNEYATESLSVRSYPNPVQNQLNIDYTIDRDQLVEVAIYDLTGHKIDVVENGQRIAGTYSLKWNVAQFKSGVYFLHLRTQRSIVTQKIIINK